MMAKWSLIPPCLRKRILKHLTKGSVIDRGPQHSSSAEKQNTKGNVGLQFSAVGGQVIDINLPCSGPESGVARLQRQALQDPKKLEVNDLRFETYPKWENYFLDFLLSL